jgi:hypothetical protein
MCKRDVQFITVDELLHGEFIALVENQWVPRCPRSLD